MRCATLWPSLARRRAPHVDPAAQGRRVPADRRGYHGPRGLGGRDTGASGHLRAGGCVHPAQRAGGRGRRQPGLRHGGSRPCGASGPAGRRAG